MNINTVIHNYKNINLFSYKYNEIYYESDSVVLINGIEIMGIAGTIMRIPIRSLEVLSGGCSLLGKERLDIFKSSISLLGNIEYGSGSTLLFDSNNELIINDNMGLTYG